MAVTERLEEISEGHKMQPDEIVFGRNAVLAYLEHSGAQLTPEVLNETQEDRVCETSARLESEAQDQCRIKPDLRQLTCLPSISVTKILVAVGTRNDARLERIHQLARLQKIPVHNCQRSKLDQLTGADRGHQGVVALISATAMWRLETFLHKMQLDKLKRELSGRTMDGYMVAVLDGIEDPHNLGAIIRVAEAAGVASALVRERRAAGLTAAVAKVSAGALATLPVVRISNLVQAIETLKKSGLWVVGLDSVAPMTFTEADLKRPLAVVIGSEGHGISRLVREHCDFLVKIPMLGKTQSLNASVAAGVFFYEVVRQCGNPSS